MWTSVKLWNLCISRPSVSGTRLGILWLLDSRTEALRAGLLHRIRVEAGQPDDHQHIDGQLGEYGVDWRPAGLLSAVSAAKTLRELYKFADSLCVQMERHQLHSATVSHL